MATAGDAPRFRLVRGARTDEVDHRRWLDLARAARPSNVFLTPAVLAPALRHLAPRQVVMAVVERDGRWQLLVPLRTGSRFWRHPVRATTTWQHAQMFLGTPLVAPGATDADWERLLTGIAEGPDTWWVLGDLDLAVGDLIAAAADRLGLPSVRVESHSRAATRRRETGDHAKLALSSKKRKELRRQWRRLEEDLGGGLEVVDLADGDVDAGVREFLAMELAGWKGEDGGAMATRPAEEAFFLEACREAAAAGDLNLLSLRGAGGTAAMAALLGAGDTLAQWKITYDEQHAAWSPGMHVAVHSLACFDGSSADLLDSCAVAGHRMAGQLHLDERPLVTLAVGLGSRRGALAVATVTRWLALRRHLAAGDLPRRARAALTVRRGAHGSPVTPPPRPTHPDHPPQEPRMSLLDLDASSRDALRAAGQTLQPHDVTHALTSHPLLTLDALAELAASLPEDSVEHNIGDLPDVVADGQAPRLDMPIDELVRTIPDNGAWAVIKNIEQDPRYSALLDECLDEIETLVSGPGRSTGREGFVFLSSPGSVTPTHIDPEFNVLLQVQGEKTMTTGTWQSTDDRQREAERLRAGGHRNLDAPLASSTDHPLSPGQGVFVPPYTPHIVRNGPQPSISLSVTWSTQELLDEALLHRVNSYVRRVGLSPAEPGRRSGADKAKLGAFRALQKAKQAVRG